MATDSVREELADLEFNAENPEVKRLAGNTLKRLGNYNILTPDLRDIDRDISKIIAHKLAATDLIKDGTTNDALVLVEAAFHNCFCLITDNDALTSSSPEAVRVALVAQDLNGCTILSLDLILTVIKSLKEMEHERGKPKT